MLSNTATPKYYGKFRDAVLRGEIIVNEKISMEMNRIDSLIEDPRFYYDDKKVEGFINFCENELTLTNGEDLILLDSFKLNSDVSWLKIFNIEKESLVSSLHGYADTAAGKWLAANCHKYGFILRYPKDKEDITGIGYEPWHFRYVGKKE